MNSVQVETGLGEVLEFLTEELVALKFVVLMLSGSHFAGICRLCRETTAVGIVNDGRVQKLYIGNGSGRIKAGGPTGNHSRRRSLGAPQPPPLKEAKRILTN